MRMCRWDVGCKIPWIQVIGGFTLSVLTLRVLEQSTDPPAIPVKLSSGQKLYDWKTKYPCTFLLVIFSSSGFCVALCLPARSKCLKMERKPWDTTSCLDYSTAWGPGEPHWLATICLSHLLSAHRVCYLRPALAKQFARCASLMPRGTWWHNAVETSASSPAFTFYQPGWGILHFYMFAVLVAFSLVLVTSVCSLDLFGVKWLRVASGFDKI